MTITRRQAKTTNPSSPLLTAHDAGRVLAFRGMVCPAGATPACLRGYYEAEQEMAAPKAPRTAITLRHLFHGSATGAETKHRVRSADGLLRLMVANSGNGWGCNAWLTRDAAKRLGCYVKSCDTLLPCKSAIEGAIPVSVYGHDYDDPTKTTI
jgi:hypothetical protein